MVVGDFGSRHSGRRAAEFLKERDVAVLVLDLVPKEYSSAFLFSAGVRLGQLAVFQVAELVDTTEMHGLAGSTSLTLNF